MESLSPHQKRIYQEQDKILVAIRQVKPFPFVLSGGTALSRFYFHHRFSEDLDFFCEATTFGFERVEGIVQKLRKTGMICESTGRSDEPGRLMAASYVMSPSSHQHPVKVDFLEDPFTGMWNPVTRSTETKISCRLDHLDQIYYRKFFSLLEQWHHTRGIHRIKDLVDLYALHHYHRSLEKTLELFRKHHVRLDEEKIIMILGTVTKGEIAEGLSNLACHFKADKVWKALQQSSKKALKKGLSR